MVCRVSCCMLYFFPCTDTEVQSPRKALLLITLVFTTVRKDARVFILKVRIDSNVIVYRLICKARVNYFALVWIYMPGIRFLTVDKFKPYQPNSKCYY